MAVNGEIADNVSELSLQDPKEVAANAFTIGKRNYIVSNLPLAVSSLGEACELLSKIHGDTAPECAEAYYYYGKALLEIYRLESGVLGDVIDVDEKEEGEESREVSDIEEEDVEDLENDRVTENLKRKLEEKRGELEKGEDVEEDVEEAAKEEIPDSLQIAWEMLELAKVVLTKMLETKNDPETERMLCETYLVLGEVSLENEDFTQAVKDFTICLERRIKTLPADSRSIAEIYYQLGVAQCFELKFAESVHSLEAAIKVLQSRIVNLKADKEVNESNKKEIVDLEELIPDIKEKIIDTNEMKAESERKIKEALGLVSGDAANDAKPVNMISIKRKKPLDELLAEKGSSTPTNVDSTASAV